MSQKDDILAFLAKGPATAAAIARGTGISDTSIQPQMSKLKSAGLAVCDGLGNRDPWRLAAAAPPPTPAPDDPTMIPGGPAPTCETRALAADEGTEPDEELPSAGAVAAAIVAAASVTGEDPGETMLFCGAPVREPTCPYCASHAAVCFTARPTKEPNLGPSTDGRRFNGRHFRKAS
jgi:hypothetical protein